MISARSFLVFLALCLPLSLGCPPAPEADAGPAEGEGEGEGEGEDGGSVDDCGDVTALGECTGSTLRFCSEGDLIEYDCAVEFPGAGCAEINADYGYDCAVPASGSCLGEDDWLLCQGTEPSCVETNDDVTCEENAGACVDADVGTCAGDVLTWDCYAGQAYRIDCGSYGGSCDATASACVDFPVGALCDEVDYFCADGLDCRVGECVTLDAGPVDAGGDAGMQDAGGDAGAQDAGGDAGAQDAGALDAGADAGFDAGPTDAGFDAG